MNIIDSFIRNILEKSAIEFLFQQVLYNKHHSPLDEEALLDATGAKPTKMPDQVGHDKVTKNSKKKAG